MRKPLLALILLGFPGASGSAFAQRVIFIPEHGSGEKVVFVSEIPPLFRLDEGAHPKNEPKVGFLYWHCYVFNESFSLWTSNGRFVLYDNAKYWEMPRERLAELLGPDGTSRLSTPWSYWIPLGLATCVAIVAALAIVVYYSASARAGRLLKDQRYQQAFQAYLTGLPQDTEPTAEDKEKAFSAGLGSLQNDSTSLEQAERSLRLLVNESEREFSYALRGEAVEYEQAGEWALAIEYYEKAARLRETADPKDHSFLLTCIERVREKQARS